MSFSGLHMHTHGPKHSYTDLQAYTYTPHTYMYVHVHVHTHKHTYTLELFILVLYLATEILCRHNRYLCKNGIRIHNTQVALGLVFNIYMCAHAHTQNRFEERL